MYVKVGNRERQSVVCASSCLAGDCMRVLSDSVVSDSVILWTVAHQASLSMVFLRQKYWRGLLFPSPGDLPDPGIEPVSPVSPGLEEDSLPTELSGKPPGWSIECVKEHWEVNLWRRLNLVPGTLPKPGQEISFLSIGPGGWVGLARFLRTES